MSVITRLKTLSRNPSLRSVGMYTFSNFFSKAASFLLLFIFTNPAYITPSENGLLSLFSNSMLFLMPFLSMGIVHSVGADYFKLDKPSFRDLFTTGMIMPVAVMLLSALLLLIFQQRLFDTYGFPAMFTWLIPLVTFLIFLNEQLLSMARNNQEPMVYLKANMGKTILELGLSFILVVFLAWRWEGRVAGILAAYAVLGIYAFHYFKKKGYLFGKIRKSYVYSELVYAIPIVALQASIFTMNASDKFFLSHYTNDNNATVGVYSIACVFASIINVLAMALIQYMFPKIYRMLSTGEAESGRLKKQFLLYFGTLTAGLIGLLVVMPLVYRYFVNEKYHSALEYSYLLCIGIYIWCVSYFFYSFLLYYKEKKKLLGLSASAILVSIACNYFFISRWGVMGAAVSSCVLYGIVCLLILGFTRHHWMPIFGKTGQLKNTSQLPNE